MKHITLSQGQVTLIDDEDYARVSQFKWSAALNRRDGAYYARRKIPMKRGVLYLAVYILELPQGSLVDHINGDTLDNRRNNLRQVTAAQNSYNAQKRRGVTSSRYKGVVWNKRMRKWVVRIGMNYTRIYLGSYDDEVSAARAYDAKARELFGEFVRCNFSEVL